MKKGILSLLFLFICIPAFATDVDYYYEDLGTGTPTDYTLEQQAGQPTYDAGTLDGYDSTRFVTTGTVQTITGAKTFSALITASSITTTNTSTAGTFTDGTMSITGGAISGATNTNWDTAYTHSQDNTQAHSDYLLNNASDTTSGILTATNGLATTYGVSAATGVFSGHLTAGSIHSSGTFSTGSYDDIDSQLDDIATSTGTSLTKSSATATYLQLSSASATYAQKTVVASATNTLDTNKLNNFEDDTIDGTLTSNYGVSCATITSSSTCNLRNVNIGSSIRDTVDINGVTKTYDLSVHGSDVANRYIAYMDRASPTHSPTFLIVRASGTHASPVIVGDGSILGQMGAGGWDGTDVAFGGALRFEVDGTPGSDDMPTKFSVRLSSDTMQTPREVLGCSPDGAFSVLETEIVGSDSEVNASVIEDKFLRNDGDDTTSGTITASAGVVCSTFTMDTSVTNGFILTTDANGVGTWQANGAGVDIKVATNTWTGGNDFTLNRTSVTSLHVSSAMGSGTPVANTLNSDNIPKVLLSFNGSGTIAISGSFNVTSISDEGGNGAYGVVFDVDFADTNYIAVGSCNEQSVIIGVKSTGSLLFKVKNESGTDVDASNINLIVMGNQ